jgi:hypothetical protein
MAANVTVSQLDGLFKDVFADKVHNLVPDNVMLYNMVNFESAKKLGEKFSQPVIVKQSQGFTYGGSDGDAYSLNAAVAAQTKEAEIKGYSMVARTKISYDAAARSATSQAAFEQSTKLIVADMLRSFAKRLEISMFYGQKEIGLVNADTSSVNTLVISDASWAPGIWNGLEGAKIEIFSDDLATDRTSTARTITAIDLDNKQLTVDGAALTLTAGDRVVFEGAYDDGNTVWKEMLGLHGIMSAYDDGVTDLFGIKPASFNVWRSTTYDAGGADLSFEKIQEAISKGAARGLDESVVCLVSNRTWAELMTDQAALRQYDSTYQKTVTESGSEAIKFHGQTGSIEVVPCSYVKESLAFVMPKSSLRLLGSTDITFQLPGHDNDRFFRELADAAGFELRAYCDLALFTHAPNKLILISNIVNS